MNYENLTRLERTNLLAELDLALENQEKMISIQKDEISEMEDLIKEKEEEIDNFDPASDVDGIDDMYNDMLNEVHFEFGQTLSNFCSLTPAELLEQHDPVGYRCGFSDFIDSMELSDFSEYNELTAELDELENDLYDLQNELDELEEEYIDIELEIEAIEEI